MIKSIILALLITNVYSAYNDKSIKIEDAHIRLMPPSAKVTAGFMKIHNNSSKDTYLIDVKSNISKATELHFSKTIHNSHGSHMTMQRVEKIKIPANETRLLEKGGHHIMFIELKNSLSKDQMVDLTLEFSNDLVKKIKVPVKPIK